MRGKPIVWEITESGCIVPTSHKLNKDDYFRTRDTRHTGGGRKPLIMSHRLVWELKHGAIPEGKEVDHMCKTRACSNIKHLQVLPRKEHLVNTNRERYADRKEAARLHWLEHKCTGIALGDLFGVSFSSACRWVREWKV
jgi:hypothetical protein